MTTLASNKSCILCSSVLYGCKLCSNQYTCTDCYSGIPTQGLCLDIVGCIAGFQTNLKGSIVSICSQCDYPTFSLNVSTKTCQCTTGFLVGSFCTTVVGCIAVTNTLLGIKCMGCNIHAGFYYDPTTMLCYCKSGFTLNNGKCVDICGDGIKYTN